MDATGCTLTADRRQAGSEAAGRVFGLIEDLDRGGEVREELRTWLAAGLRAWLDSDGDLAKALNIVAVPRIRDRMRMEADLARVADCLGASPYERARRLHQVLRGTVEGRRLLAGLPPELRPVAERLRRNRSAPTSERHLLRVLDPASFY